ncbi:putative metal-binding protein [Hartmannibacter diazotrophicus]|uniref:Putative metal-binding protein n=1 Tax=Hartmannibacter diazotrophicus TaxID=1482074 RepID=A0A2C9D8J8_9HYPH|nr:DUF1636 domain-containing protein [Hartmannibacter diazotrophicus]SON56596.1 putative metal-binding protein [Hartmannibacter diazotrophicus]
MSGNDKAEVTLFVCTSCRRTLDETETLFDHPGEAIHAAMEARLADEPAIRVEAVDCLAVCKRPATVALSGDGFWTYLVGDLTAEANLDEIEAATRAYLASGNGIIPWRERPVSFRKGVVARMPPLPGRARPAAATPNSTIRNKEAAAS